MHLHQTRPVGRLLAAAAALALAASTRAANNWQSYFRDYQNYELPAGGGRSGGGFSGVANARADFIERHRIAIEDEGKVDWIVSLNIELDTPSTTGQPITYKSTLIHGVGGQRTLRNIDMTNGGTYGCRVYAQAEANTTGDTRSYTCIVTDEKTYSYPSRTVTVTTQYVMTFLQTPDPYGGRTVLDVLSIDGPESVAATGLAAYTCTATMSDGTETNAVPTWGLASGAAYASINAETGVLSAHNTTYAQQTVEVSVSAELDGETRSAVKAIKVAAAPLPATAYDTSRRQTLSGAVYDADDTPVGTVALTTSKLSRKGVFKVSGSLLTRDGKKHAVKAKSVSLATADLDDETGDLLVPDITVKDYGPLTLALSADGFTGALANGWMLAPADVGRLPTGSLTFALADYPTELNGVPVLTDYLPRAQSLSSDGRRFSLPKAGRVKYTRKTASFTVSKGGDANPSGLKLSYAPRTGLVKGSFALYTFDGRKLKKWTAKVTGFAVDGAAYLSVAIPRATLSSAPSATLK